MTGKRKMADVLWCGGHPHFVAHSNEKTQASGIVIFLHGAGDTGPGVEAWTRSAMGGHSNPTLVFPHLKIIYPTSPKRKYTAGGGYKSTVWFDWKRIDPRIPEELSTIDPICHSVCAFIDDIVAAGTPINRIVLGGLSMGGVLALHVAYRFKRDLAGVFALSTFLHEGTTVYDTLKNREEGQSLPPLFFAHGMADSLIYCDWGKKTFDDLQSLGVEGSFHSYQHLQHSMSGEELEDLRTWIMTVLPQF